jgi:hypothetical protein
MLEFSARHSVAPVVEYFPIRTMRWSGFAQAKPAIASSLLMTESHAKENLEAPHGVKLITNRPSGIAYKHSWIGYERFLQTVR